MANNLMTVDYKVGNLDIHLDANIVRNQLVNGQGNITDQELSYFLNLCKAQKLNPFIKDCYLIKYGDRNPAQMVVSKDLFLKRAEEHPQFDGLDAGIIVERNGEIIYRHGAFYNKRKEELLGGWCEVFRKDRSHPIRAEVAFDEYVGINNKTGKPNSMWATKGATMIRKVALCQALRDSFPNAFQQLYGEEEMNIDLSNKAEVVEAEVVEDTSGFEECARLRNECESLGIDTRSDGVNEWITNKTGLITQDLGQLNASQTAILAKAYKTLIQGKKAKEATVNAPVEDSQSFI